MPARHMFGHLLKQPVIEVSKDIAAEFAASLGERLFTDASAQGILAGECGEELIEFGLPPMRKLPSIKAISVGRVSLR